MKADPVFLGIRSAMRLDCLDDILSGRIRLAFQRADVPSQAQQPVDYRTEIHKDGLSRFTLMGYSLREIGNSLSVIPVLPNKPIKLLFDVSAEAEEREVCFSDDTQTRIIRRSLCSIALTPEGSGYSVDFLYGSGGEETKEPAAVQSAAGSPADEALSAEPAFAQEAVFVSPANAGGRGDMPGLPATPVARRPEDRQEGYARSLPDLAPDEEKEVLQQTAFLDQELRLRQERLESLKKERDGLAAQLTLLEEECAKVEKEYRQMLDDTLGKLKIDREIFEQYRREADARAIADVIAEAEALLKKAEDSMKALIGMRQAEADEIRKELER